MPRAKLMRLLVAALVFVVLLIVTIRGCDQPPPPIQPDNAAYRVVFPDAWTVHSPGGKLLIGLSPTEGAGDVSRENISIAMEQVDDGTTAQTFLARHVDLLTARFADAEVGPVATTELAGHPAAELLFTYDLQAAPPPAADTASDGTGRGSTAGAAPSGTAPPIHRMRAWVVATVAGRRGFVIVCTASDEAFESHRPVFRRVLDSFALKPEPPEADKR